MSPRITASLFGAALALTVAAAAEEDINSANYVMRICRAWINHSAAVMPTSVSGYCTGLVDGLAYAGLRCLPDGVTTGQMILVVVAYIDARPARLHDDFKRLALEALRAAWPCR
jgi:Rap1a immunity proteins